MEGLGKNPGETTEKTIVREWTEVKPEAGSEGEAVDWLDKVSLEDLEQMDSVEDLYERLNTPDAPDDNEGPQKVKRW